MMSIMEEFDHLKIQIEDILSATDNFSKTNLIGGGGFGLVYKGKLSLPMGQTTVAFKRLDRRLGQGNLEFLKEITMLSKCKHENLISLLHFCSKDDERVLVYEYASRGSLDQYLGNPSLTWSQRLHICIGVARALEYLHDKEKPQGKIIHRDIKSSNILLDEKWSPKVSDFGLSKVGSTTQAHTVLVSNPVGTVGYCDPVYWGMGFLSKESDIYSFGVVLFEVMCGRLCCEFRDGQLIGILVHRWKTCCDEKKVGDIIFQDIREQIDMDSIIKFSTIANQCLNSDRRKRPKIHEIIQELEGALLLQKTNHVDLVIISKLAVPPLSYKSQGELISLLSKGILVDKGKRWLSINKHEEIQELISATECFRGQWLYRVTDENSRFLNVFGGIHFGNFKADLRTQFLSPHVMYTINLVFKHGSNNSAVHAAIKYKLEDETDYLKPTNVYIREDGWLMSELYQFTSYQKEHSFKIEFVQIGITSHWRHFEGIEFRPINHEKQAKIEEKNNKDMQLSNSDTDWEPKMSPDYIYFAKLSKKKLQWTTKKELYFLFRTGFLVHDGDNYSSYSWLSISKNMRYRLMKPATTILSNKDWIWTSLPESRFKVVAESYDTTGFDIAFQMKTTFLSIKTTYSCCLIYKLPENSSLLQELITIVDTGSRNSIRSLYLTPPAPIPIVGSMVDQNYASPSQNRKIKGHPKLRKDGWMELPLCEVSIVAENTIPMQFNVSGSHSMTFAGLIIQGVEFRPL